MPDPQEVLILGLIGLAALACLWLGGRLLRAAWGRVKREPGRGRGARAAGLALLALIPLLAALGLVALAVFLGATGARWG